jgi:hypothetical protein
MDEQSDLDGLTVLVTGATPKASYVTGATIAADGGRMAI